MRYALLALLMLAPVALAANWPGWRGPEASGISPERGLPVEWSRTSNVRWKVPVRGAGVSSPVVWGDRIFLTASEGRLNDRLHVYCHHRADGRLLWHTRLFGSAPTDLYAPGGMAVPTPTTDGERLYCLFGTGDLACLDLEGRPVWVRCLAEEYGPFRNRWGMGTSPILVGDMLVVQVDHWSQSYLLAVDARTGANRWKTDRDSAVNWTSPLAVKTKGGTQIVAVGTHRATGYDARTGKELWHVTGLHQQCIPSPVAESDLVFIASGEGTLAVRLDGKSGDVTKSNVVWNSRKISPFVPSPGVYRGLVYVVADKGIVTCLEAATGKQVWKERLGEQYHASVVAGDGKLYFASKEGVVRVVQAGPTFRLLAANDLGEPLIASPAISDGQIFLRGEKHLFCIGGK
ncbi:MAG: PQQ-binding-like beta-propeller repeat protein [Gemmataceae bacterium]|nr:PQQ-binding-like beta-propeller repeat protein [Gemmataceae bacterium]